MKEAALEMETVNSKNGHYITHNLMRKIYTTCLTDVVESI